MKRMQIVLVSMLLLVALLAGCGSGDKSPSSTAAIPPKESSSTSSAAQQDASGGSSEAPAAQQSPASSAAPSSAPEPEPETEPEAPASSSGPEMAENPEASEETFDAAAAVAVEETDGGIKVTFHQLPQTEKDIEALLELYPRSDARNVSAFFLASLVRYVDSPDDAFAMIDVLRGPQPMSDADKSFMKERLSDKLYLPRAYFEGAVPKNEYQPDEPWVLVIYDDPVTPPEGYAYTQVKTSGADNSRRIVTRLKDDLNYLWEYNGSLLSIRLPASEDPWA